MRKGVRARARKAVFFLKSRSRRVKKDMLKREEGRLIGFIDRVA